MIFTASKKKIEIKKKKKTHEPLLSKLQSGRNEDTQKFSLGSDGASCLAVGKSMPVCAPPNRFHPPKKNPQQNAAMSARKRGTLEAKGDVSGEELALSLLLL